MNRLARETSPYLLQHAHNPVDWYPWGEEALQRARTEDKPILVSIGYSACHWCHVMERESFEDPATADLMNGNFINIKIDREERPDLDHIYMDAVQALGQGGGWPLNVFLTPEAKPFYGGTYFPPVRAHNRASWKEVLQGIIGAFRERRAEIEDQAGQVTEHLKNANHFGLNALQLNLPPEEKFTRSQLEQAFQQAMSTADRQWGGFGRAPKFPQTFTIGFLLRHYYFTRRQEALDQACLSLDKMIMGGIYDHIGGGFARYSTDNAWLVPHFEKMLYDNALLVQVLAEAYQLTRKPVYAKAIRETLDFVTGEMTSPENGWYSALDADSEGVEGKYYIWTYEEVKAILGEEAQWFCRIYDITPGGNWNPEPGIRNPESITLNYSIPHLEKWPEDAMDGYDPVNTEKCRRKLAEARRSRPGPQLDDKILLGWNALMNQAFVQAAGTLQESSYIDIAEKNMRFLLERMTDTKQFTARHSYKAGEARFDAFLDDYAFLVRALIALHEITGKDPYLDQALGFTKTIWDGFSDEEDLLFYYTHKRQEDVIVRKKEIYDGAIPSGNAVMAYNLRRLSVLTDEPTFMRRSESMMEAVCQAATRYPGSFGIWTQLLTEWVHGTWEIAITGKDAFVQAFGLLQHFVPNKVVQHTAIENQRHPLLKGKPAGGPATFFLCRNYSCRNPVNSTGEMIQLIESELKT